MPSSIIYWMAVLEPWLLGLELRDSPHDSPELAERIRRKMLRGEDWVTQNHMGSIVLIKPGVLRCILIHVGHWGLHLLLRAVPSSRAGYLGSMRAVHFAHWAFLNNSSRLIFLSNLDHCWDSYLDDFIEKAHAGLTLAWGCGAGFPTTKLLFNDLTYRQHDLVRTARLTAAREIACWHDGQNSTEPCLTHLIIFIVGHLSPGRPVSLGGIVCEGGEGAKGKSKGQADDHRLELRSV